MRLKPSTGVCDPERNRHLLQIVKNEIRFSLLAGLVSFGGGKYSLSQVWLGE